MASGLNEPVRQVLCHDPIQSMIRQQLYCTQKSSFQALSDPYEIACTTQQVIFSIILTYFSCSAKSSYHYLNYMPSMS